MANTHRLAYKSSRKSHRVHGDDAATALGPRHHDILPRNMHSPDSDFVLYPDPQATSKPTAAMSDVVYGNDGAVAVAAGGNTCGADDETSSSGQSITSSSFVPWESPMTQQEEISSIIRDVDSSLDPTQPTYNGRSQPQSLYPPSIRWLEFETITPTFQADVVGVSPQETLSQPLPLWVQPSEAVLSCLFPDPYKAARGFLEVLGPVSAIQAAGLQESSKDQDTIHTAEWLAQPSSADAVSARGVKRDRDEDSGDEDEDEDEDGKHQHKRHIPGGEPDESNLACPFRKEDPTYFNRDNDARFSACYTSHAHISTLV